MIKFFFLLFSLILLFSPGERVVAEDVSIIDDSVPLEEFDFTFNGSQVNNFNFVPGTYYFSKTTSFRDFTFEPGLKVISGTMSQYTSGWTSFTNFSEITVGVIRGETGIVVLGFDSVSPSPEPSPSLTPEPSGFPDEPTFVYDYRNYFYVVIFLLGVLALCRISK